LLPGFFFGLLSTTSRQPGFFPSFSLLLLLPRSDKNKKSTDFSFLYSQHRIKAYVFLLSFHLVKKKMANGNPDQTQFYTATCGQHTFTVPVRYQDLSPIGLGAFGAVM
jgi:hypothetical protein